MFNRSLSQFFEILRSALFDSFPQFRNLFVETGAWAQRTLLLCYGVCVCALVKLSILVYSDVGISKPRLLLSVKASSCAWWPCQCTPSWSKTGVNKASSVIITLCSKWINHHSRCNWAVCYWLSGLDNQTIVSPNVLCQSSADWFKIQTK